ncbi:MAG: Rrf2 family transcriptional regulator [Phycisphaerae bacterium]|nr:Rrf2 family transcriptional regulator [Phycisphaerae bacterium]
MTISQKCQYAIRATFELAKNFGKEPLKISYIAEEQNIPVKFLEAILAELKEAKFLTSKRGAHGGYTLKTDPAKITVLDIIKFIEGPMFFAKCISDEESERCPQYNACTFLPIWQEAQEAVSKIFKSYNFAQLVANEKENTGSSHDANCL